MYSEEDLLPISALSQLVFCERRAGLILVEGLWRDNVFTAEGSLLHEHTHLESAENRGNWRTVRGLWLRSFKLGVYGRADVVELYRIQGERGAARPSSEKFGQWQPLLVEHKRGRLRREASFEVQLCAQAMCLEEMLGTEVKSGVIYYDKTRRRLELKLGDELRQKTVAAAERLHELVASGRTPPAVFRQKCRACSMLEVCLPTAMSPKRSVARYLRQATGMEDEAPA
jgi:CRISPR-associated exonuclease Cas4